MPGTENNMDERTLARIEGIFKIAKGFVTREDLNKAFEVIIDFVRAIEEENSKERDDLKSFVDTTLDNLESQIKTILKGKDGKDGRDGKSGSNGSQGERGERGEKGDAGLDGINGSPDTAEDIRNKLELLQGDDRLKASAISGLDSDITKKLEQINKRIDTIGSRRLSGGRKTTYVKRINLTSQLDSNTKTFKLPVDTIEVLGVWGTQFPINFNPGTDWTFAGNTLTLTDEVSAPETGQTLYCLVETMFY